MCLHWLAGIHTNYLGQVERGEKNLTLETLEKIIEGLGVSFEEIFRFLDPMKRKDALGKIVGLLVDRPPEDREIVLEKNKVLD
ncbi:helix-turn-helix domain-containing protein [Paenibacillus piri]|uniref:XRE family transcriptional regulator n=1 Tax=Paenibacillus piri TaxID=2547395 RepID=A0A4R5K986_9BACL|nr:XRE family transcriptional regulator [Paenibacillus piri]